VAELVGLVDAIAARGYNVRQGLIAALPETDGRATAKGKAGVSEVSTRIWLDEALWEELVRRATAQGTTIRELVPRLLAAALSPSTTASEASAPGSPAANARESREAVAGEEGGAQTGPTVVPLAEVYRCAVCGEEVRLSRLSAHLGRHLKESQTSEA